MTASLHHAQPILAAALTAGFRESGIQSLKNLDDPTAFPMVAIRTSGLALGSVVGCLSESEPDAPVRSLVEEDYLALLVRLANERFGANAERVCRLGENLFARKKSVLPVWEDKGSRRERLRSEGLERQRGGLCVKKEPGSRENLNGLAFLDDE